MSGMWTATFIVLFLVGLIFLISPKAVWTVSEQWKSEDATEPSIYFIWLSRLSGVFLVGVGLVGLYVFIYIAPHAGIQSLDWLDGARIV